MAILLCKFEGCDRKHHGLGLCEPHYHQKRRGSTLVPLRDKRTVAWRLDQNTNKSGPRGCWLWEGSTIAAGYGHLYADGRMQYVHRLSYERHKGVIPEGLYIDHECHTRNCLNPEHLRLATHGENMQNLSGPGKDNTSGYVGVHYYKSRDKYVSRITHEGKDYNLGYFLTKEAAWEARKTKELELFSHSPLVSVLE